MGDDGLDWPGLEPSKTSVSFCVFYVNVIKKAEKNLIIKHHVGCMCGVHACATGGILTLGWLGGEL